MRCSDQVNDIAVALAKVQGTLKPALKDSENEAFKRGGKASRYADLTSVWDACREALAKNEIAVVQAHDHDGAGLDLLVTRLVHKSGQWFEASYPIRPTVATPQGFASATTYARRISLASMVGVVADDDDGNAASARPANGAEPVALPQSTMSGRKNESAGLLAAREFVNAEALPALAAMKKKADLDKWLGTHAKTLDGIKAAFPEQYEALEARISRTLERVDAQAAAQ